MPNLTPAERQQIRDAIDALPEPTRSVYLAHLVDGLDYVVIGERESLSVREVEGHIAGAIILIDRYLREWNEGAQ